MRWISIPCRHGQHSRSGRRLTVRWPTFLPQFEFSPHVLCQGDLVGLNVLGTKILVLNTQKAINDLLDKRVSVYSDRPVFTAVGELMGLDQVRRVNFPHLCLLASHVNSNTTQESSVHVHGISFKHRHASCASRIVPSITYGLLAQVIDTDVREDRQYVRMY